VEIPQSNLKSETPHLEPNGHAWRRNIVRALSPAVFSKTDTPTASMSERYTLAAILG
jgi:hypothetical protein